MNNYQSGVVRQGNPLLSSSKFSKKITMFGLLALMAAGSVLTSCKKESADAPSPGLKLNAEQALSPVQGASASLTDVDSGKVYRDGNDIYTVSNYFVSQGIYSGSGNHIANGIYFFDFSLNDNKKGATATTAPSSGVWDISLSGTGNADIRVNTDATEGAQIKYLNVPFATVLATYTTSGSSSTAWTAATTPPAVPFGHNRSLYLPPATAPAGHVLTTADYQAAASGHTIDGWYNYYFPKHTVYGTSDITILIKDKTGNVYALHMIGIYKNAAPYEPGDNTANPPADYSWLKFEYKKLPL
ncbi:MAG: hypothetical protein V4594_03950 [Bacteroidota bacterium]